MSLLLLYGKYAVFSGVYIPMTAENNSYILTAETFSVDPILSENTISFRLVDENGNHIVDESGNNIGGDTLFIAHNIKLSARHIDTALTTEV